MAARHLTYVRVKLCDFGVATIVAATADDASRAKELQVTGTNGSPSFFSPEMCSSGPYSGVKADLWACGVSLYLILYGRLPYEEATVYLLMMAIRNEEVAWPTTPQLSDAAKDLLKQLLCRDPTARPAVARVFSHPWLAGRGFAELPQTKRVEPNEEEIRAALNLRTESAWASAKHAAHASSELRRLIRDVPPQRQSVSEIMFEGFSTDGIEGLQRVPDSHHPSNLEC